MGRPPHPSFDEPHLSGKIVLRYGVGLLLLAGALQGYTLCFRTYPPLIDLPNHMARHYLESRALAGESLPPGYAVHFHAWPNLGADLILPLLLRLLPALAACKLFLALSVLLYWLGAAAFIWQYGGYRPASFLASCLLLPLTFSSQLFWGFLNYYSGLGLAFLVLAHYFRLSRQERLPKAGLLFHSLLVTLLFLWHLAPWGIYGVIVGCHLAATLARDCRRRSIAACWATTVRAIVPVLPSVVLLAMYVHEQAVVGPAPASHWGSWTRKALMVPTLFRSYDVRADGAVALLWFAALLIGFGSPFSRGFRWGWLPLALGAFAVLYLLIPFQLGSTSDTDSRLLPALLICALAWLGSLPLRRFRLAVALIALCLMVRFTTIVQAWSRLADRLDAQARAFDHLQPGSRLLPIVLTTENSKEHPETHFHAWSVVFKDAFDPALFAIRGQQPLSLTLPFKSPVRPVGDADHPVHYEVDEELLQAHYDFIWLYNPAGTPIRMPTSFEEVFTSESLTLWRRR